MGLSRDNGNENGNYYLEFRVQFPCQPEVGLRYLEVKVRGSAAYWIAANQLELSHQNTDINTSYGGVFSFGDGFPK